MVLSIIYLTQFLITAAWQTSAARQALSQCSPG
jgi:hypothetical protein